MTYLQLVNKVLVRLRESEVSSVSQDAYSKLIGELINQTKREVEDSWNWVLLRTTIQVPTSSGTFRYTLTGAGNRFRILKDEYGRKSVFNDTDDYQLRQVASQRMTQLHNGAETQNAAPVYFDFNGATSGDPNVDFWPVPDGSYNINFDLIIPQDDLSADADELTLPEYPVILGAYAKALAERGEDGGFMFAVVESNYQKSLSDAVALDAGNLPFETVWMTQ